MLRHAGGADLRRRCSIAIPNLRVATIETGSYWVAPLLAKLKKAYGQMPIALPARPGRAAPPTRLGVAVLRGRPRARCASAIGADHILFGSDYPHAEGLAEPTDFVNDLEGLREDEIRLVMRENAMGLLRPWAR